MAINFNDNILNRSGKDLNDKTGVFENAVWRPFNSVAEALASPKLVPAYRSRGLTIYILKNGQLTEYWWRDGIANNQLIEKITTGVWFNISYPDFEADNITYNNPSLVGSNYTVSYSGNTSGGGSFDRGLLIEGTEYNKLITGGFVLLTPYKANPGDIFQISNANNNSTGSTIVPSLQNVTSIGNTTSNVIQVSGTDNLNLGLNSLVLLSDGSGNSGIYNILNNSTPNIINFSSNGDMQFGNGSRGLNIISQTTNNQLVGSFGGRVKGDNAVNIDEFTTLGQVNSLIGAIPTITASNGLNKSVSNDIKLGGPLTVNTVIGEEAANRIALFLPITSSTAARLGGYASTGNARALLTVSAADVQMSSLNNAGTQSRSIQVSSSAGTSGIPINDGITSIGLVYLANYAANNTTNLRWITDKEYVDSKIAAASNLQAVLTAGNTYIGTGRRNLILESTDEISEAVMNGLSGNTSIRAGLNFQALEFNTISTTNPVIRLNPTTTVPYTGLNIQFGVTGITNTIFKDGRMSGTTGTNNNEFVTKAYVDNLVTTNSPSNLALGTRTSTTMPITNSNGTGVTLLAATSTLAGLMVSADFTKLAGIAPGATANQTDAFLLNRANHTGTQLSTTISDFNTAASAAAPVQSVAGKTGVVLLVKGDVGLGNVDNTTDLNKPISTATQTALNLKANIAGQVFTGNISAPNLSGTNTGDQDLSPYQLISNLQTNLTASATKYPSVNAVNTGLATKQNVLGFTPENVANKVADLSSPNSTTYIHTLGLSNILAGKVNTSTPVNSGYGIDVGGDLSTGLSIELDTTVVDNRYLRKDINDNNSTFGLTLGTLSAGNSTFTGTVTIPSLGVGTSDDILIVNGSGVVQKKTLVIAGDFGIANAAGTNQFDVALGTDLRFEGANDTTVTFDPVTKKVTISSVPGSGGGGAVVSFNTRTGAVVPVSGDYTTALVTESGNLYFTDARSIASPLTGFSATNSTIIATDTILQGFNKTQGQLNAKVGTATTLTVSGTAGRITIAGGTQTLAANRTWTADLATVGTAGTYKSVTTDAYGRVTAGTNPTTLAGFGITDAYTKTEADGKYYLQTNPAGYITAASLPDLTPYALKDGTNATGLWTISTSGNAATATKLLNVRTINGVSFDGTTNIVIADSTKEPIITAGTNLQYWRGDKTWQTLNTAAVPESGSLYYTNARGIGSVLTGFVVGTNAAIVATDTILAAFGKVQAQINARPGTVTSVGLTSTDLTVSGSPVTSSGNITANIAASAVTFAKMQNVATATLVGRGAAGTGVLSSITLGTGLSLSTGGVLSATNTNTGTVTSVGLTAPTGLTVSGSPVTTSGTLALTFTAGYSIPTTASQSNWDTAFSWGNHAGLYAPIAHVGSGGTAHAIATTSVAGFMSSTDKTKLDGITGANTGDQTLFLGASIGGQIGISGTGGNTVNLASLAPAAVTVFADSTVIPTPGFFPYNVTTGSTGYPSVTGAGLKYSRSGSPSSVGNFEFFKSASNDGNTLYLRSGTTGSSFTPFQIIATQDWVQSLGLGITATTGAALPSNNADLITHPSGIYAVTTVTTGIPVIASGSLIVERTGASGYITQKYQPIYATDQDDFYIRHYKPALGTWSPWNKVYHDGNFTPGNYVLKSGDTMTGALILNSNVANKLRLQKTASAQANYIQFLDETGTQSGYVGHGSSASTSVSLTSMTGDINLVAGGATRMSLTSTAITTTVPFVSGDRFISLTQNERRFSYASNGLVKFTDGAYYVNNSASVTGTIQIKLPFTSLLGGPMFSMKLFIFQYSSSNPPTKQPVELIITGYGDSGFANTSVWASNPDMIGQVRFGNDGTSKLLLISSSNSNWAYVKVAVKEVWINHAGVTGAEWQDPANYPITMITDETGIVVQKTILNSGFVRDSYINNNYVGTSTSTGATVETMNGANMNTITRTNVFWASSGSTNRPTTSNGFISTNYLNSTNGYSQQTYFAPIATASAEPLQYFRGIYNGTIGNWFQYASREWTTANFAPAIGGNYVLKTGDTMTGTLNGTNGLFSGSVGGTKGYVGAGASGLVSFYNTAPITGGTSAYANYSTGEVQSGVTTAAFIYRTQPTTQAAAFTLAALRHFEANQGTIGAGSSITDQVGFLAGASLIGATGTNTGFYGNIPAGTGRWNFYANGTAQNYFNGNVGIGITVPTEKLHVVGNTIVSGFTINSGLIQSNVELRVNGGAGTNRVMRFTSDTGTPLTRWALATNATAESGSNAGSDFTISRYNDAGTLISAAFAINRATGDATFSNNISASILAANNTGSATVPVFSFLGDPNTGLYNSGADQLTITTGGVARFTVGPTLITSTLPISLATAPSIGNHLTNKTYVDAQDTLRVLKTGDTMTGGLIVPLITTDGIDTTSELSITVNSVEKLHISSNGVAINGTPTPARASALEVNGNIWATDAYILGTGSAPIAEFGLDGNVFLRSMGTQNINFRTGGSTTRMSINGSTGEVSVTNNLAGSTASFSGLVTASTAPTAAGHLTNKAYVDSLVGGSYVTTNTTQTGLSGNKTWTGNHIINGANLSVVNSGGTGGVGTFGVLFVDTTSVYSPQTIITTDDPATDVAVGNINGRFTILNASSDSSSLVSISTSGLTTDKTYTLTNANGRLPVFNTTAAPASSSSTGTQGEIRVSGGFMYVCIATNSWVRATASTF